MYCVRCGKKAEKGQKRCIECGMRLISPEALLKLLKKADLEKKLKSMESEKSAKSMQTDSFVKGYMDRLSDDEGVSRDMRKKAAGGILSAPQKKKSEQIKKLSIEMDQAAVKKPESIKDAAPKKKKPDLPDAEKPISGQGEIKKKKPQTDAPDAGKAKNDAEKATRRVTPLFENPTQPKRRSIFDETPEEDTRATRPVSGGGGKPENAKKAKPVAEKKQNPVVKLPEKKKASSKEKRPLYIAETDERPRRKTDSAKQPPRKAPEKTSVRRRPDRTKAERAPQSVRKPRSTSSKPAASIKSAGGRKRKDDDSFTEKHLRSIISMVLLTITVVLTLMWGYSSESGLRTMAQFGLGSRKGYILLGDDCMMNGNYKRAVEHYYKALSKKVNYEAGLKLSWAYRRCGDIEKETSALLLLMDQFHTAQEPYDRIMELYPYPDSRPAPVQKAISMYENGSR